MMMKVTLLSPNITLLGHHLNVTQITFSLQYLGFNYTVAQTAELIFGKTNPDGFACFIDFLDTIRTVFGLRSIRQTFNFFDLDHSGRITPDELKSTMSFLGEELVEDKTSAIITIFDTNGDGTIDIDEFTAYVRKLGHVPGVSEDIRFD